jgi:hypothetical protein
VENLLGGRVVLGFSRKTTSPGPCILRREDTEHAETNISTAFVLIINLAINSKSVTGKKL